MKSARPPRSKVRLRTRAKAPAAAPAVAGPAILRSATKASKVSAAPMDQPPELGAVQPPSGRWLRWIVDSIAPPSLTEEGLGLLKSWILLHPEIADERVIELERIAVNAEEVVEFILGSLHPAEDLRALWRSRRKRQGNPAAIIEEEIHFLLSQVELEIPELVRFWRDNRERIVLH